MAGSKLVLCSFITSFSLSSALSSPTQSHIDQAFKCFSTQCSQTWWRRKLLLIKWSLDGIGVCCSTMHKVT
jgi:hypothetical protein